MRITFYGGAGGVTGSRHLLESDGSRVLLDCGLFQGHRAESAARNREVPFPARELAAALLSHAHMDHCGTLPVLVKAGFAGAVHCTAPTADLCGIMLMDAARLQQEDAAFFNKIHQRDGQRIDPLYDEDDARACLQRFAGHGYGETVALGAGLRARFLNAGHVLGSAMILLEAETRGGARRLLFTGDLGRRRTLLLQPPEAPGSVDTLVIESTYGDRLHEPIENAERQLAEVLRRTIAEKGKLLIPTFALERAQEIVFIIEKLVREGAVPHLPVIVDSPMAVDITQVFSRNLGAFYFESSFLAYVAREGNPFDFKTVRSTRSAEESKAVNDMPGPLVVLSASGMCEGGRILHHLRNNIGSDTTTVLLVGYQAEGTLGRRLQDGARKVRIFGLEHEVAARVEAMHTFSSHADRDDLLAFIGALKPPPRNLFLVHGDPEQRSALAARLRAGGLPRVDCPDFGESFELN